MRAGTGRRREDNHGRTNSDLGMNVADTTTKDRPTQHLPEIPEASKPEQHSSALGGLVAVAWMGMKQLWHGRELLQDSERRAVIDQLFPRGMPRRQFFTRFVSLMMLSTSIAVFGILSDSTAVVIGAMLVAPLMLPVLGGAAAIVMGWPRRILHRAILVAAGSVLAVTLAAAISFLVPGRVTPLPAELMARTSPNLLDLGIALAAGAAGAYGQVRRHAAEALTGVAVAVALVPPLAVVGITLQLTEWQYAVGAALLFLANVVGIVIAASATFLAAGFVPGRNPLKGHTQILRGVSWAAIAAIIVVIPMQFGRGAVLPVTDPTEEVTVVVEEYVAERSSGSEVVDVDVEVDNGITKVDVVVASSIAAPLVDPLARRLADYLSSPVQLQLLVVSTETERARVEP
jgi:uncharacterized hydrophobic protein (TIGR00271 family)